MQEEQPGGQEVPGHAADAGESAAAAGPLPGERQQGAEGADGGEGSGVGQAEVIRLFSRPTVYSLQFARLYLPCLHFRERLRQYESTEANCHGHNH